MAAAPPLKKKGMAPFSYSEEIIDYNFIRLSKDFSKTPKAVIFNTCENLFKREKPLNVKMTGIWPRKNVKKKMKKK
jgi:hypothetical protein